MLIQELCVHLKTVKHAHGLTVRAQEQIFCLLMMTWWLPVATSSWVSKRPKQHDNNLDKQAKTSFIFQTHQIRNAEGDVKPAKAPRWLALSPHSWKVVGSIRHWGGAFLCGVSMFSRRLAGVDLGTKHWTMVAAAGHTPGTQYKTRTRNTRHTRHRLYRTGLSEVKTEFTWTGWWADDWTQVCLSCQSAVLPDGKHSNIRLQL